jgi:hypothetical protein
MPDIKVHCLGKVKHKSLLGANYVREQMRECHLMDVYKCKFCKNYHIGHAQIRNKKKKHKPTHENKGLLLSNNNR